MKRAFFIVGGALFFVWTGASGLKGADLPEEKAERAKLEAVRPIDETYLKNRVNELERRISQLEQEIRYLEDQTRNLDRRVDDLRQHHV